MALAFDQHEISIQRTGQRIVVPDNDIARLMYYLQCVCRTIECNDEPEIQRFTNYSNWYNLSTDEQQQLVVLCYSLSPDIFDDKVFFQSDDLCIDTSNEFYEISEVSHQLVAARSIIIAGRTRRVNQIMTYQMNWMRFYYLEPMRRQAQRLNRRQRSSHCVVS